MAGLIVALVLALAAVLAKRLGSWAGGLLAAARRLWLPLDLAGEDGGAIDRLRDAGYLVEIG